MSQWPNGKKFAVCLTHDVDRVKKTHQYFTRFFRFMLKKEAKKALYEIFLFFKFYFKKIDENPYWTFEKILEIEKNFNVKSTFFILNETGHINIFKPSTYKLYSGRYNINNKTIVCLIKKLDSEGFEIGLHGSYKSYLNKNVLKMEKEKLEFILGKKILGIRQHYLNLEIPTTWKYQEEIGLKYDSSFGLNRDIGYRENIYYPFFPIDSTFLEIPMTIMDSVLLNKYRTKEEIINECMKNIEIAEKNNGLICLLWHTERFDETDFPGQSEIYQELIKICKDKDAWITKTCEIYKWWSNQNMPVKF